MWLSIAPSHSPNTMQSRSLISSRLNHTTLACESHEPAALFFDPASHCCSTLRSSDNNPPTLSLSLDAFRTRLYLLLLLTLWLSHTLINLQYNILLLCEWARWGTYHISVHSYGNCQSYVRTTSLVLYSLASLFLFAHYNPISELPAASHRFSLHRSRLNLLISSPTDYDSEPVHNCVQSDRMLSSPQMTIPTFTS